MKLKVREIFYSIQGEGARQGEASIFIRLAKCNLNCWFCDTDWSFGTDMTVSQIKKAIKKYNCEWIVWTGGEPTLQLTNEILREFKGYKHAIETNGTNPVPSLINYITCSPKVGVEILHKNFPKGVDEFRYPVDVQSSVPKIKDLPKASNYYVSPVFLGEEKKRFKLDMENAKACIDFVQNNPEWKLSLQIHKFLNIL